MGELNQIWILKNSEDKLPLANGLLVHDGIIRPVVNASPLAWFIRYISNWNLQLLNY